MALNTPFAAYGFMKPQTLILCACLFLAASGTAHAQEDQRAVRAAYLFNLSKYVSWPHDAKDLKICSEADERTGQFLKSVLEGKDSNGRMVHVVLDPTFAAQRQCSILYLGNAPQGKVDEALREVGNLPVLTVSDNPQFVRRGGMVGLIRADDQIQLHVNLAAVRSAGIQMSSRLLSVAVIIRAGGQN